MFIYKNHKSKYCYFQQPLFQFGDHFSDGIKTFLRLSTELDDMSTYPLPILSSIYLFSDKGDL